jgi:hypothetical protein
LHPLPLSLLCSGTWCEKRRSRKEATLTSPTVPSPPDNDHADPIKDRLRSYPNLYQVLGESWLDQQVAIHPAKSRYALARWLRIDGYEVRLNMLDRLLGMFEKTSGIAERRRRISGDAPSLEATVVELHFAAWLTENGIRLEMPKVGADFRVELSEGAHLPIEAMTPRRKVWFDDLFARLTYIKRGSGFSLKWGFHPDDLPDDESMAPRFDELLTDEIAVGIVDEALTNIAAIKSDSSNSRSGFEQARPDIGFRASWLNDGVEYMSGRTSPRSLAVWDTWVQIRNAARIKTENQQLPPGQTSALLVGTNQLDDGLLGYWADWVERVEDEWVPLKWEQIPPQIKYVMLYKVSWSQLEPQCALLLINVASAYPDVPGFDEFRERMFPILYRKIPTRFAVWASTDRCFNRSWF